MTAGARRADIQGLRGIAVLMVVAYHSVSLDRGFQGVDVFFVISGFVITELLGRDLRDHGTVRLRSFYARRVRRLLPALAVFIPVVLGFAALTTNPYDAQPFTWRTAAAAQAFVANFSLYRHVGYFDSSAAQNPFLHMWSLSVEEQFYLVFPIVLLASWRWRRRAVPVLSVLAVASFVLWALLNAGWGEPTISAPVRFAYFSSPTRAWEFLAGSILALTWSRWSSMRRSAATALGFGGAMLLLLGVAWPGPVGSYDAGLSVAPVAATVALIAAGAVPGHAVGRVLAWRPLTATGDVSYAWYLWHWPAIVVARTLWPDAGWVAPLAAAIALAPAVVSTRLVEQPARSRPLAPGRIVRLTAVCIVVPALVTAATWPAMQRGWGVRVPDGWWDLPAPRMTGCNLFNRDIANDWPEAACTTTGKPGRGTALVLGDQQADSISPAVAQIMEARGIATATWTRTDCPFQAWTPPGYDRCAEWNAMALDLIDRLEPVIVVMANDSADYLVGTSANEGATAKEWQAGIERLLDRLARRGVPVVLVSQVPDYGTAFPRDRVSVIRPTPPIPVVDRARVTRTTAAVAAAERAAVSGRSGVAVVDPVPVLCDEVCTPVSLDHSIFGDQWWYYEAAHLNRAGSLRLVPAIRQAVDEVWRSPVTPASAR